MAQKKRKAKAKPKPNQGKRRSMRNQQIVMAIIGVLIILSMVISLIKF